MKSNFSRYFLKSKFLNRSTVDVKTVFSLSNSKELLTVFHKHLRHIVVFASGLTRVSPRLRHFHKFMLLVTRTYRHHGASFTVIWLKSCHIAIQKYLAGEPFGSLRALEPLLPLPRLYNGLPGFIGSMDRKAIREGHTPTIRLWLSILSIYRILDAPVKAKLNTITDPYSGSVEYLSVMSHCFHTSISEWRRARFPPLAGIRASTLTVKGLRKSLKAGPNSSVAYRGLLPDAIAITKYPWIVSAIKDWCRVTNSASFFDLLNRTAELAREGIRYEAFVSRTDPNRSTHIIPKPSVTEEYEMSGKPGRERMKPIFTTGHVSDMYAGRLHGIKEAAGKLRIIAIVDSWTQSLFRPLHDQLFELLRLLPNDGTFDQDKAFSRCLEKSIQSGKSFSVDLSSATDRLPIDLQESILNSLYGSSLGSLWRSILHRPFVTRVNLATLRFGETVWYGCGQPMGCLSSWAMLAVTHHFILQFCCQNVFQDRQWHTCYEILGDDLVIFDDKVYHEYLRVMELLAVGTNPSKSLASYSSLALEFAKRTGFKGIDVSALSWKMFISTTGVKARVNLVLTLGAKGILWRDGLLSRLILGTAHHVRNNLLETEASQGLMVSLLAHFASRGFMRYEDAIAYVVDPSKGEETSHEGKVPVRTTVHDLLTLLWAIPDSYKGITFDKGYLSLSRSEIRHRVGTLTIFKWLRSNIFLETLSRLFLFEEEYEKIPGKLLLELTSDVTFLSGAREFGSFKGRFHLLLLELSRNLLYGFKDDDQGVFDMAWENIQMYERTLGLSFAIDFRDKLEAYVSKFKLEIPDSDRSKAADLKPQWLRSDIGKVHLPERSAYWKLVREIGDTVNSDQKVYRPPLLDRMVPPIISDDTRLPDSSDYSFWSKVAKFFVPMDKGKKVNRNFKAPHKGPLKSGTYTFPPNGDRNNVR